MLHEFSTVHVIHFRGLCFEISHLTTDFITQISFLLVNSINNYILNIYRFYINVIIFTFFMVFSHISLSFFSRTMKSSKCGRFDRSLRDYSEKTRDCAYVRLTQAHFRPGFVYMYLQMTEHIFRVFLGVLNRACSLPSTYTCKHE